MSTIESLGGTAVPCAQPGCGHAFPEHRPQGGPCATPCLCRGFRWVPLDGPPVGYGRLPQPG